MSSPPLLIIYAAACNSSLSTDIWRNAQVTGVWCSGITQWLCSISLCWYSWTTISSTCAAFNQIAAWHYNWEKVSTRRTRYGNLQNILTTKQISCSSGWLTNRHFTRTKTGIYSWIRTRYMMTSFWSGRSGDALFSNRMILGYHTKMTISSLT